MTTALKIALLAAAAVLFAYISYAYLQPPSAEAETQYQSLREKLAHQDKVSEEESKQLELLFRRINSVDNIKADLQKRILSNALFFLVLLPLTALAAARMRLGKDATLAGSATIFIPFVATGALVTGALTATLFFIVSIVTAKRAVASDGP